MDDVAVRRWRDRALPSLCVGAGNNKPWGHMKFRSLFATLLFSVAGLYAQDFRATVTGTVTDPSGARVPNAKVTAVNTAMNTTKETQTDAEGVYTIPYLDPGVYNFEFQASGFQILRRESITLSVAQKLSLNVSLPVGQAATEVTVAGEQEVVDTADASRGVVFDPLKTQEYPLNGRQSYMLMMLTPGVLFTTFTFGPNGNSGTRAWDVTNAYKFNGARSGNGNNAFLLNGAIISNEGSTWEFAPSVDAIQEFKVETNAFDAQYGHEAGGVVNTTIKSGTNSWHGDVYDYWRYYLLDANSFNNNTAGTQRGYHNQHQFGGVLGGPIRKDKDFIFMSFEGWQEVLPFPTTATTVPMDMRTGNFSNPAYGMTVYDPLTRHACGAATESCSQSTYWQSPFPGNQIPASRISPVAQKILGYLPAPNTVGQGQGGISGNYVSSPNPGRYWYNQPIVRFDHTFSDKDKFNAMFSQFHGFEFRSSNGFAPPLSVGNTYNNRTYTGINLDETHVISPTMVLDLRANFMRFVQLSPGYTSQAQAITPQSIGMTNMTEAPTVTNAQIPNISLTGFATFFGSGSYSWSPYNSWQFTPNLTWTKGRHAFKAGFEYHYEARGNVSLGQAYGSFSFDSTWSRQQSSKNVATNDQYLSVASLLLGLPQSGNIDNNATSYYSRPYYGWYFDDDWKVTDKLLVSVGLRYDIQLPYLERYNQTISRFDLNAVSPESAAILAQWNKDAAAYNANPANKYPYPTPPAAIMGAYTFAGQNGLPRRQFFTDFTDGAPRLGFAYQARPKTVIRGGFGTFYQSMTQTGASQTGFSQSTGYVNSLDGENPSACATGACLTGPYSLVQPFPTGLTAAAGSSLGLLSNYGQGASATSLDYKIPRTYQYSLNVQQALPKNMVLEVGFAGNFAGNTQYSQDISWPQDAAGLALYQQGIADPNFFSRQVANPFLGLLPASTSRGSASTVSAASLMNSYPLWGGGTGSGAVSNNNVSRETFRSDALQVRFEKKAFGDAASSAGVLTWIFSWTFSKEYALLCCSSGYSWMTDTAAQLNWNNGLPNGLSYSTVAGSGQDSNLRYQMDSNNQTQQIAFSGVWDPPIGKNRRFFSGAQGIGDKIASGWRVDYMVQYVSGQPVGLPNLINYCGVWTAANQSQSAWFNNNSSCYAQWPSNTSSFTYLPPRFSGNVNNPTAPQVGLAVEKNTNFKERYKLSFRAEAFNAFNTPIRPGPSTTFPSSTFGVLAATQQNFPRQIQLALKLYF
jgi:hypothetical protein